MSLSTSRCAWHKIAALALLLLVGGCASAPTAVESEAAGDDEAAELEALFEDFGQQEEHPAQAETLPDATSPAPAAADAEALDEGELFDQIERLSERPEGEEALDTVVSEAPVILSSVDLSDWEIIRGGFVGNALTGIVREEFVRPVALAARGEYVYVVDDGLRAVLRYDRASERLEQVLALDGAVTGEVTDIYVNPDFSFYLTDPDGGRVILFGRDGRRLQVFQNRLNMAKPVAIAVLDGGHIVVADGHYDYLVRFNSAGTMVATYAGRGLEPGRFLNIITMAQGPDGYYVGARVGRKLQVVSREGAYRYSFEEGAALFPSAIVVDDENRAYVADYMDDRIKVFDRGRLVATVGHHGVGPGQFKRISDLWLDDQFLYIADTLNGRIQIARVAAQRAAIPLSK